MSMARLLELQAFAEQHKPEHGAWLKSVIQRYREGEALDRAAELTGFGALRAAKAELLAAAELLDPNQEQCTHRLAGVIAAALREFERQRWSVAKALLSPETLPVLDACFWRALMNSNAVPRSKDRIADVLAQRGQLRQSVTWGLWLSGHSKKEFQNAARIKCRTRTRRRS